MVRQVIVVHVLNRANQEWWKVRNLQTTAEGFVPANYVQPVALRVVNKEVLVAQFSYAATFPASLSISENEQLEFIDKYLNLF